LQPEVIPLTHLPDFYWYNIFGSEDFYEKFLGVLAQAPGSFAKISNWEECIQMLPDKELLEKFKQKI
jgi:hypothetical protein